jgi:hypothetical protein
MASLELANWRREPRAFGRFRWTPPEGEDVAEIIIRERVRPLTTIRALVAELDALPETIGPVQSIGTLEGELAAVVDFRSPTAHHSLGVIIGDDFETVVSGKTAHREHSARVRKATEEIVVHLPLGLGTRRPRRFLFEPPPGWQGLARGMISDWFPLDYPRTPSTIKVLPARPLDDSFRLDTFFRDDNFAESDLRDLTRSDLSIGSFKGTLARASGTRTFVTAVLEDLQFIYVLRLTTKPERLAVDEPVFMKVLESCVPLPMARSASPAKTNALDYLADY